VKFTFIDSFPERLLSLLTKQDMNSVELAV
jgi:hypothetical protein